MPRPLDRRVGLVVAVIALVTLGAANARAAGQSPLPDDVTSANLPSDADLQESWARVAVRANPGPFHYLAYEVTMRGQAGVVSHVRGFMGRGDVVSKTDLLRKHDVRRLFGWLRDQGVLDMPQPATPTAAATKKGKTAPQAPLFDPNNPHLGPAMSSVPVFDLSFRLGGRERTVLVADPLSHVDRRYAKLIGALRQVALAATGDIAYQPPTGAMGTQGYLFIDSVPSAEVTIDGVPIGESTPVLTWTVAAGAHTISLENKRLGLKRETRVKVQPGVTTSVELTLP